VHKELGPTKSAQYPDSFGFGSLAAIADTFKDRQHFIPNPELPPGLKHQVVITGAGVDTEGIFSGLRGELDALRMDKRYAQQPSHVWLLSRSFFSFLFFSLYISLSFFHM
jgi:hypothetical protein